MHTQHKDLNIAIRDLTTELLAAMKSSDVRNDREGVAIERALARFAEEVLKRTNEQAIDQNQPGA
jgi:hypothetical protein